MHWFVEMNITCNQMSWIPKCVAVLSIFICSLYIMVINTGSLSTLVDRLSPTSKDIYRQNPKETQLCTGYGTNKTNIYNSCIKRLPNCLIIGAEKGGTYALLKFLSAHPQVVRNTAYDELYFFDRYYSKGIEWYRNKMPYSFPGQIVLEKTPSYFIRREVPARVFRMNPNIRLLLVIRNPVHRSISDYAMKKEMRHGFMKDFAKFVIHPSGTFEPSSSFIQHSLYDYYLEYWLKFFKLEQIHIIDGDSFSKYPVKALRGLETFLNIDHYFTEEIFVYNSTKGFYCLKESKKRGMIKTHDRSGPVGLDCLKETKGRKHPAVSSVIIKKMKRYFRPHNEHFYNLTGKYYNWDT